MKNYKKMLAGLMAISMFATLMVGCSPKDSTEDATTSSDDSASADVDTDSATVGSSSTEEDTEPDNLDYTDEITDGVVLSIGDNDIDVEEYRYYFLNLKNSFDGGDDTYWDGEATEGTDEEGNETSQTAEESQRERLKDLKDYVVTFLINNYCVEQMAKDNGVELDADELADVEQTYEETKESYESDDSREYDTFEEYLTSTYCTKELYMKSITRQALEQKLVCELYEDDFRENLLPEYVHCKHILFSTTDLQSVTEAIPDDATDEEREELNAENEETLANAKAEVKAKAEDVLQQIRDGADFDEMLLEYNEDPGEYADEDGNILGYYFTEGTMVDEFEDACFALGDNEVSDIVETSYGYHIIKRIPITDDDEYVNENLVTLIMQDPNLGTTTEYYDEYMDLADSYYESMNVTYGDDYYNINTQSLPVKSSVYDYVE
jgi:hypothetical protein